MDRFTILFVAAVLSAVAAGAQRVELGPSFNHLSSGIAGIYTHPLGRRVEIGAGIRYAINTYSLNENRQGYAYYQNGFANNFGQHFGFIFRPSVRIYGNRYFGFYLQANFLVTDQSLKYRGETFNMVTGQTDKTVSYFDAALAVESTIGLRAYCNINTRWSIQVASGVGYIWLNYSYYGRSLTYNIPLYAPNLTRRNATRGDGEFTGLDGLPMLYLGIGYNLNHR